jgi:flagellar basal body-associated protein FliL
MVMIVRQCCGRRRCRHGQQQAQAQTANRKTGGGQTIALLMLVVVVAVAVTVAVAVHVLEFQGACAVVGAVAAPSCIILHQTYQQQHWCHSCLQALVLLQVMDSPNGQQQ